MDQQISHCVRRGGLLVDNNKVLPAEVTQQTRRRVDGQACAADDEGVGPADGVHGIFHRLLVQPFLVEHNIGLDDAAALVAAGHAVALPGGFRPDGNAVYMMIWYAASLFACLGLRNTYEKTMDFRPTVCNALSTVLMILYCTLSLSSVSVFLYFNF